jgi:hypothetical protein
MAKAKSIVSKKLNPALFPKSRGGVVQAPQREQ